MRFWKGKLRQEQRELYETVEEVNQINNTLQAQGLEISEKSNEILTQNEELQAQMIISPNSTNALQPRNSNCRK